MLFRSSQMYFQIWNKNSNIRPSTGNVRTKINRDNNQVSQTQGDKIDFFLSKSYSLNSKFEKTFENDQNRETQKKSMSDFYNKNNTNNNNKNNDNNDNKNSSGNFKKKPLQPFWESIRIEKEKQSKELKKLNIGMQ